MTGFSPINLTWKGVEYTIPADRVLRAIGIIEEVVTLSELSSWGIGQSRPQLSRVAEAYAHVLRYAGAKVTDAEVWAGMFGVATDQGKTIASVQGLLSMVIPPGLAEKVEAELAKSNGDASPKKSKAVGSSSKRRSKRLSSAPASSGRTSTGA